MILCNARLREPKHYLPSKHNCKHNWPNRYLLPARASEQGNVIGSVSMYIYVYIYIYIYVIKKKL